MSVQSNTVQFRWQTQCDLKSKMLKEIEEKHGASMRLTLDAYHCQSRKEKDIY